MISRAWNAAELQADPAWIYVLSPEELQEVDAAVAASEGVAVEELEASDFPLPTLAATIASRFLEQLEHGLGTVLIRGLPVDLYPERTLPRLLHGLGLYFGTARPQSPAGELLHEVRTGDDPTRRGTRTAAGLNLHNDPCDVTALLCVRQAAQGGASQVVSSLAVRAALGDAPELLEALHDDYPSTLPLPGCDIGPELLRRPIFAREAGRFVCNLAPHFIEQALADPEVPDISARQAEALQAFRNLARSATLCHEFMLQPGDLWLVNNYLTLHARRPFTDGSTVETQRLLLRLWLAVPNSRPLPESYRGLYRATEAGAVRGGYPLAD
ncbi:MAG: TauD/TfdA family dioxygenase [Pseudomonadota bacterium]